MATHQPPSPYAEGNPETPPPGVQSPRLSQIRYPVRLSERASLAARRRTADLGDTTVWDQDWLRRAIAATRLACTVLGADPATVHARPDHDRYALFGWLDVRLIVDDHLPHHPEPEPGPGVGSGRGGYEFICASDCGRLETLLLLQECPECARLVPTYAIRALADLGEVILAAQHAPYHRLRPNARQYPTDPAHLQDCPIRRNTLL